MSTTHARTMLEGPLEEAGPRELGAVGAVQLRSRRRGRVGVIPVEATTRWKENGGPRVGGRSRTMRASAFPTSWPKAS